MPDDRPSRARYLERLAQRPDPVETARTFADEHGYRFIGPDQRAGNLDPYAGGQRHETEITALAIDPESRFVATGGMDHRIRVTRRPARLAHRHRLGSMVRDLAVGSDSSVAALDARWQLWQWDAAGKLLRKADFWEHFLPQGLAALSPDATRVVFEDQHTYRFLSLDDGSIVETSSTLGYWARAFRFDPSATRMVGVPAVERGAVYVALRRLPAGNAGVIDTPAEVKARRVQLGPEHRRARCRSLADGAELPFDVGMDAPADVVLLDDDRAVVTDGLAVHLVDTRTGADLATPVVPAHGARRLLAAASTGSSTLVAMSRVDTGLVIELESGRMVHGDTSRNPREDLRPTGSGPRIWCTQGAFSKRADRLFLTFSDGRLRTFVLGRHS